MKKNVRPKWYAVIKGVKPGIYTDWESTKEMIHGFSGAVFKSFDTQSDAERFFNDSATPAITTLPEMQKAPPKINLDGLSDLQLKAVDLFKFGRNIFITGPGGSGKSFLINTIVNIAKENDKNVQVCAMTGCAALLLNCGAKTVHSWGGIGLAKEPNEVIATTIDLNNRKKRNWKKVDVLIIDEVSMMSKKVFELLDLIAKKTRRNGLPFGGIQVVFSGDFFQLPPVKSRSEENLDAKAFCFESSLWNTTFRPSSQIEFTEIFRQKDKVYAKILNQIRKGALSSKTLKILNKRIGVLPDETNKLKPTILLPIKSMVEKINITELDALPDELVEYHSENCSVEECGLTDKESSKFRSTPHSMIEKEKELLLNSINCDKVLKFKIGAQVMCTVNLDLNSELPICNGSLGIITKFTFDGIPIVKFNNGLERPILKHIWKSDNIPGVGVKQLPLVLAWAITIHKSQGATLDLAEIDVGSNIFEAGQTYVALSRVKSLDGLFLKSFNPDKILINKKVKQFYNKLNELSKLDESIAKTDKPRELNAFDLLGMTPRKLPAYPVELCHKPSTTCKPPSPETI